MNALRTRVTGLLEVVALFSVAGFVLGLFGRVFWIFDLFSHFRLQYAVALLSAGDLLLFLRRPRTGGVCLLIGGIISISLAPWFFPKRIPTEPTGPALRLVSFNVNTANSEFAAVVDYLASADPDLIFLMEVNDGWMNQLAPLDVSHPHRIALPREDNFGLALWSRFPLAAARINDDLIDETPMVDVTIQRDDTTFRIIGVHPVPPMSQEASRSRNDQLQRAARLAANSTPNVLLIGDLNLTPFSPHFADLLATKWPS